MCQNLRCLPKAGGLFDQDAYHIYLLESALIAQQRIQEEKEQKAERAHKSPSARRGSAGRRGGASRSGDWVPANKFD